MNLHLRAIPSAAQESASSVYTSWPRNYPAGRRLFGTPLGAEWIARALDQLKQIDREAAEEGYPPVGDNAKARAKHLLSFALAGVAIEPAVYPSMDGEVAIYFKSPVAPVAVLILLNDRDEAGCYASICGKNEHKRYDNPSDLPDEFLNEKLRALGGTFPSQREAMFRPATR